jgi:uncharacterized protein YeaC (DUF1315 family)
MRIRSLAPTILIATITGVGVLLALVEAGPSFAQKGEKPAPIPCEQIGAAIDKAPGPERVGLAVGAIARKCSALPASVMNAVRAGRWDDGAALQAPDRTILLARATTAAYPEAESLVVKILEVGSWPDEVALTTDEGAQLVRSLKDVLTPYRVRLLLDVFEQVKEPAVRQAVLQTLRASKLDVALLPALEAAYDEKGPVQEAGLATISAQPEKTPPELHARLIRKLAKGPILDWAVRLAKVHPSGAVAAALKTRGITG